MGGSNRFHGLINRAVGDRRDRDAGRGIEDIGALARLSRSPFTADIEIGRNGGDIEADGRAEIFWMAFMVSLPFGGMRWREDGCGRR